MRLLLSLSLFTFAFLSLTASGCHSTSKPDYPNDPLFVSKKPIEVKPEKDATHLVQRIEPTAVRAARQ